MNGFAVPPVQQEFWNRLREFLDKVFQRKGVLEDTVKAACAYQLYRLLGAAFFPVCWSDILDLIERLIASDVNLAEACQKACKRFYKHIKWQHFGSVAAVATALCAIFICGNMAMKIHQASKVLEEFDEKLFRPTRVSFNQMALDLIHRQVDLNATPDQRRRELEETFVEFRCKIFEAKSVLRMATKKLADMADMNNMNQNLGIAAGVLALAGLGFAGVGYVFCKGWTATAMMAGGGLSAGVGTASGVYVIWNDHKISEFKIKMEDFEREIRDHEKMCVRSNMA